MKNIILRTLTLTLASGLAISAQAAGFRSVAKKTLDGSSLFCPAVENQSPSSLQLQMRVVDAAATSDVVQVDLLVRSVKCVQKTWVLNSNVLQNGTGTMADYEILALDNRSKVIFQTKLAQFEKSGEEVVTIGLPRSIAERLGQVEIFVRAKQTQTSSIYGQETFLSTFGSYNLILK